MFAKLWQSCFKLFKTNKNIQDTLSLCVTRNGAKKLGTTCSCTYLDVYKRQRYGGDEFIIIYAGASAEEVYAKAAALRQNIMDLKLEHLYSKALPIVTISQGISYGVPENGNRSWDFLHTADMLLYQVKKRSRNDICIADIRGQELDLSSKQEKVEP